MGFGYAGHRGRDGIPGSIQGKVASISTAMMHSSPDGMSGGEVFVRRFMAEVAGSTERCTMNGSDAALLLCTIP